MYFGIGILAALAWLCLMAYVLRNRLWGFDTDYKAAHAGGGVVAIGFVMIFLWPILLAMMAVAGVIVGGTNLFKRIILVDKYDRR